jgi:hypothetical protein
MTTIPHFRIIAALALAVVVLMIFRSLVGRDRSAKSRLDLDDLLIDPATDRISKAAAVLLGSYMTLAGKLTDVLFAAYLAVYATPAVVKIIGDRASGNPPTLNPPA